MDNLLQRLKAGTSNYKLIDWPGSSEKIAIRILSQGQLQEAAFETERIFKTAKIDINMMTADEYTAEKSTQILFRALRNPTALDQPIGSIIDFKQTLTLSEKEFLIEAYNAFEAECSPNPENLPAEKFEEILQAVKKNPSMINTSNYNTGLLKRLIMSLANPLQK